MSALRQEQVSRLVVFCAREKARQTREEQQTRGVLLHHRGDHGGDHLQRRIMMDLRMGPVSIPIVWAQVRDMQG
jgi:hypothetical protein